MDYIISDKAKKVTLGLAIDWFGIIDYWFFSNKKTLFMLKKWITILLR